MAVTTPDNPHTRMVAALDMRAEWSGRTGRARVLRLPENILRIVQMSDQSEYIEMMFKLMEYDNLTDSQHDYVCSFERHYMNSGKLSDGQVGVLEDIFQKAAEK